MSLQSLAVRPELVQIGATRRRVEWLPCKEFEFSDECSMVSVQARMGSHRRAIRDRRDDFHSWDRAGGAVRRRWWDLNHCAADNYRISRAGASLHSGVFSVVFAEDSVILLGHYFTVAGEFFRQLLESRSSRTLPFVTLPSRRLPRARASRANRSGTSAANSIARSRSQNAD